MCKALTLFLIFIFTQNPATNKSSAETEIDRRLDLLSEISQKFRQQLRSENPQWLCSEGTKTRYGRISIEVACVLERQAFHINLTHYSSSGEAAEDLKVHLNLATYPKWREVNDLGQQAIVTDGCERTWLRFRKGRFFIFINGNVNDEASVAQPSRTSEKLCERGRDAVSEELSQTAQRIAKVIDPSIDARSFSVFYSTTISTWFQYDGNTYSYEVSENDLVNTPSWDAENSEPPLSSHKALGIASTAIRRFVKQADEWQVNGIAARQAGVGKWIYDVSFSCSSPNCLKDRFSKRFTIFVKMDGSIIEPLIKPIKKR